MHFHDLRHVGDLLVATTGASLKELMARMGQVRNGNARRQLEIKRPRSRDAG